MWIAEYGDGEVLPQFDPKTGKENLFKDIDIKRLKRFGWHNFGPEMAGRLNVQGFNVRSTYPPISVVLDIREGEELVAVRRNAIKYSPGGGYQHEETVYVLGIKDKAYVFISEDGTIEMSSDFNYR
jgi:hypothetical protein